MTKRKCIARSASSGAPRRCRSAAEPPADFGRRVGRIVPAGEVAAEVRVLQVLLRRLDEDLGVGRDAPSSRPVTGLRYVAGPRRRCGPRSILKIRSRSGYLNAGWSTDLLPNPTDSLNEPDVGHESLTGRRGIRARRRMEAPRVPGAVTGHRDTAAGDHPDEDRVARLAECRVTRSSRPKADSRYLCDSVAVPSLATEPLGRCGELRASRAPARRVRPGPCPSRIAPGYAALSGRDIRVLAQELLGVLAPLADPLAVKTSTRPHSSR